MFFHIASEVLVSKEVTMTEICKGRRELTLRPVYQLSIIPNSYQKSCQTPGGHWEPSLF